MGIGKDFKFTERVAFQFRAEAFNVFNHAQYGYDPNTATSIGAPVDNNPNDTAVRQGARCSPRPYHPTRGQDNFLTAEFVPQIRQPGSGLADFFLRYTRP